MKSRYAVKQYLNNIQLVQNRNAQLTTQFQANSTMNKSFSKYNFSKRWQLFQKMQISHGNSSGLNEIFSNTGSVELRSL